MAGRSRRDRTEVSCVIKYLVFGFNVLFWVIGGVILGVGIWAWSEKDMFAKIGQLTKFPLDPALLLIIAGLIIFIIGFLGCVGALRENTILLLMFCICVGVIFFFQLLAGVLAFVYNDWVKQQIKGQLKTIIQDYREDPDLQNLIDWVQADWLKCCGVISFNDWEDNIYFNCSSPSRESCGVPFSCCKPVENEVIVNKQCGYDVRKKDMKQNAASKIYVNGCVEEGEKWLNNNLIPVAAVVVGIALVQVLGICFAQNLRSDIFAQMSKWN